MEKLHSILIIDDDPINNFLFSKIIMVSGVAEKAETVISGKKGLEFLEQKINSGEHLPDIIFLDINMPVMNGWEFLERYHAFPEQVRQQIRLYMLSSSVYHEDLLKAKSYEDVVDYITKPLTKEILFKIREGMASKGNKYKKD